VEPISVAVAAFAAIKSGVKLGKDAHSMMGDIGKMWGSIDEVRDGHKKKKKRSGKSINEEALETYAAQQKCNDLEIELKKAVIASRGFYAWDALLKVRGEIKKKRIEEEARRQEELRNKIEMTCAVALFVLLVAGMFAGVWLWLG